MYQCPIKLLLMLHLMVHSSQATFVQDPGKIVPKSYALHIQPFPEEDAFSGEVTINVVCLEKTNVIRLTAHKNLTINDTKVMLLNAVSSGGPRKTVNVQKIEKLEEVNALVLTLETYLYTDAECEVAISFSGQINVHDTYGLFKKTYVDINTKQSKWVIGSQLSPNYTHTVFPCFDNPRFKVPIDVTIQRPVKLNSLSTMPLLKNVNVGKEWVKDVFSTSPPMSVSSLGIFVSDLLPINFDKPELQIRIWSATEILKIVKENRSDMVYKAHLTYQELFGVKYPIPKLDYIALPSSADTNVFSSWGIIISSNTNLGYPRDRELRAVYLELQNQWIGNLITGTESTPDEKISEQAFTYFVTAYLSSKNQEKENQNEAHHLLGIYSNYYELGNAITSDDQNIRNICSTTKAKLIFKMLLSTLTDQTFRGAFKNFIEKCQFKVYRMDDFWEAFTKQAHADKTLPANMSVNEIALYWINNYRLPYITATRNYETNSVLLTQRLFIRQRPYDSVENKDKLLQWTIPIVLKTQDALDFTDTKPIYWMHTQEQNLQSIGNPREFIIINPEEIVPCMVNYDKTNWNMLANFLQSSELRKQLPLKTRAKLIHDALNLAYAGTLDFGTALNVTAYLKDESEYIPWRPFFIMFDHIGRHIGGTKAFTKYQAYISLLTKPLYERLKTKKNPDRQASDFVNEVEAILRQTGNKQMLKDANIAYKKWTEDPNSSYKDVRKYLCTIFEYGTQKQWDFGIKTLQNLDDKPEIERYYLFKCMIGCTKDHSKIKTFLNMTLFEQNNAFTDDDFNYATFMLTGNADGYMATFDYLRDNWDALKTRLQDKPEAWKQLIYTATNLHKTKDGLDKVTKFYALHRGEFGGAEETITKGINKIKEEVQWTNSNLETMEDWLDNYILKNSPK